MKVYHGGVAGSNQRLNISVASYDRRGRLVGFDAAAPAGIFQLCNGSYDMLNAAFNFGVRSEGYLLAECSQIHVEAQCYKSSHFCPQIVGTQSTYGRRRKV